MVKKTSGHNLLRPSSTLDLRTSDCWSLPHLTRAPLASGRPAVPPLPPLRSLCQGHLAPLCRLRPLCAARSPVSRRRWRCEAGAEGWNRHRRHQATCQTSGEGTQRAMFLGYLRTLNGRYIIKNRRKTKRKFICFSIWRFFVFRRFILGG